MKFVTIKESHYVSDLTILKGKLESEGIKCTLKDEFSTQVLSHLPNMMVKLQISEKDIKKANKILTDIGEILITNDLVRCLECDSEKISYKYSIRKKVQIFMSLIISLFTLNFENRLNELQKCYCKDCGNVFYHKTKP